MGPKHILQFAITAVCLAVAHAVVAGDNVQVYGVISRPIPLHTDLQDYGIVDDSPIVDGGPIIGGFGAYRAANVLIYLAFELADVSGPDDVDVLVVPNQLQLGCECFDTTYPSGPYLTDMGPSSLPHFQARDQ